MSVPPELIWCNAALQTQAWEDPARRVKIKFDHLERTLHFAAAALIPAYPGRPRTC